MSLNFNYKHYKIKQQICIFYLMDRLKCILIIPQIYFKKGKGTRNHTAFQNLLVLIQYFGYFASSYGNLYFAYRYNKNGQQKQLLLSQPYIMKRHDSDEDQGFVPTKVQIKADHKQKQKHKHDNRNDRPIDFQTRFILGDGILRKQPSEIYTRFRNFLQTNDKQKQKPSPTLSNKKKEKKDVFSIKQKERLDKNKKQQQKTNKIHMNIPPVKFLQDNQKQFQQQLMNQQQKSSINIDVQKNDFSGHPYEKYIVNEDYSLIYSRYRQRIQTITPQSDDFSANQINLSKVLAKYDGDHYSMLKQFEYPQPISKKKTNNEEKSQIRHTKQPNKYYSTLNYDQKLSKSHNSRIKILSQQDENLPQQNFSNSIRISHFSNHSFSQQLQFDSRFQCGNLLYAFKNKVTPNSYVLFLQNDTNSYGYTQWFNFSLRYTKPKTIYKFSIVNFRKNHSLFKQGMKISVFSLVDAQKNNGNGWRKMGKNIKYQKSSIKKFSDKKFKFYTLSFQLQFEHQNDYVCISMNIPYSYSRLIQHINLCAQIFNKEYQKQRQNNDRKQLIWQNNIAGYSISNNAVPFITIKPKQFVQSQQVKQNDAQLADNNGQKQQNSKPPIKSIKSKKAIIILARQHPGQTVSSFLMEQILYFLAQNCNQNISWLLENYVFKIFPMINVDGVIYGNFRCDLGGFDLNRNWRNPDKNLHPQIFGIKTEIQKIHQQFDIQCVLDLHGHSKQYNSFSYSCKNDPATSRILSLLISQLNPIFHFPYCTFGISKYKQTTARGVIYNLTGNQNILTIENSFYGAKIGQKVIQYQPEVLGSLGKSILQGLCKYFSNNELKSTCQQKIKINMQEYLSYQKNNEDRIAGKVDSGSQSDPFVDQISIKDKIKKILPKSFKAIQQQLEQEQKYIKKKQIMMKKRLSEKKPMKQSQNYKSLNPNMSTKSKSRNQGREKVEQKQETKNNQKTTMTHLKKNSKDMNKKQIIFVNGLNSEQSNLQISNSKLEQQKKDFTIYTRNELVTKVTDLQLPFYIRQKPTLVPIKLKNNSLEIFQDAYNATKNLTIGESNQQKSTTRNSNKKIKIMNLSQNQHIPHQFPLLCILSEEKKRHTHYQKNNGQKAQAKVSVSLPNKNKTYVQNQKLEHLIKNTKMKNSNFTYYPQIKPEIQKQKLKSKSNHAQNVNANLISKMWRQNFARYGKDLNIFFGGIKH